MNLAPDARALKRVECFRLCQTLWAFWRVVAVCHFVGCAYEAGSAACQDFNFMNPDSRKSAAPFALESAHTDGPEQRSRIPHPPKAPTSEAGLPCVSLGGRIKAMSPRAHHARRTRMVPVTGAPLKRFEADPAALAPDSYHWRGTPGIW